MRIKSFSQFITEGRIDRRHSQATIVEMDAIDEGLSYSRARKIVDRVYTMVVKRRITNNTIVTYI